MSDSCPSCPPIPPHPPSSSSCQQIPLFKVFMSPDAKHEVGKVLDSGYITQGKKVEELESKLRDYFHYPYILTVQSGTAGLCLAVRLLNLSPEDEVITTALTCTATNWAILENRVKIKWVDVDPSTCNINLDEVENHLTEKTKAVMVVHWGGYPVNLSRLREIQQRYEDQYHKPLHVIEDCAHAFGATYQGKNIGTHGNICVFSCQAIKHFTCGDGGLLLVPNKELYDRAKRLRWFGIDRDQRSKGDFRLEADIPEWGYKFHMNDINATIGLCNLPHVDSLLQRHRDNAKFYTHHLGSIRGVDVLEESPDRESSYWIYTMKVVDKPSFLDFMSSHGIMVSQVHNRNDHHSCVSSFQTPLPRLDRLEKEIVSIPVGWWVTTEQRQMIVDRISEWSHQYLSIRELQPKDHLSYLSLLSQLTHHSYHLSDSEFSFRMDKIRTERSRIYVIERQGAVIATLKLIYETKFGDGVCHIEDVVVDPSLHHRGIGTYLIRTCLSPSYLPMEETDHHETMVIYKTILDCKPSLIPFYQSCGFQQEGTEMVLRPRH